MLDAGAEPASVAACVPERYDATAALATLFQERGLTNDAARAWERAAALDPTGGAASWVRLANTALSQGRSSDALDYARKALARLDTAPPSVRAGILQTAALASRAAGEPTAALDYAERSLRENPNQLYLIHLTATLHYEQGGLAEAIRLWTSLLDTHAQDLYVVENRGLFHRYLGKSYERLGHLDAAIEHYRQAVAASPRDTVSADALKKLSGAR
jgi:tetratricopeptide (TPR) repeat protein